MCSFLSATQLSASIPSASKGTLRHQEMSSSSSRSLFKPNDRSNQCTAVHSPVNTAVNRTCTDNESMLSIATKQAAADMPCALHSWLLTGSCHDANTSNNDLSTALNSKLFMKISTALQCTQSMHQKLYLVAVAKALIVERPMPGMELTVRLCRLPCRATAATASSDTFTQPCRDNTCTHE